MKPHCSRLILATAAIALLSPLRAEEAPALKVDPAPVSRQAGVITSFAPVVEKVAPSVVQISTSKDVKPGKNPMYMDPFFRHLYGIPDQDEDAAPDAPRPQRRGRKGGTQKEALGLGSGVVVSAEGHILTNNHVVEGADDILVTLPGDKKEYKAKKIGVDPGTDLAVLKIENGKSLPAITFGDSDKLKVGDFTIAVGNPFGLTQSVTMGIVSSVGRNHMGIVDYENFIQTDASINPGNSGGALVDIEGRLIGINTAIFSRTGTSAGIGFAVPANLARQVMDSLVKNGKVVRGFLGVGLDQPLTEELARKFKVSGTEGALVATVQEKSPAEKAGMEAGDIITEFNGQKVEGPSEFRMAVSSIQPGTSIKLKYVRDGKEKAAEVVLAEMPNKRIAANEEDKPESSDPDVLDGVTVADIDDGARKQYGIPENVAGVVVTRIETDSACADAGIRVGDVIQEIERKKIKDANTAVQMSESLKKEKEVMLRVSTKGNSRFIVVKE